VFIDKPFTCSTQEAEAIFKLGADHGVPIMSCSVLRYLDPLLVALEADDQVVGVDCFSPLNLEPTNPGWFWYGIHGTEMLFRVLGKDCVRVTATVQDQFEVVVGEWADGRIGTIRGTRTGNWQYGATLHYTNRSVHCNSADSKKPMAVTLLERMIEMFRTGRPDIEAEETLAIIRFIEAVNRSRSEQTAIRL
jgi:predicted dehydrogenase